MAFRYDKDEQNIVTLTLDMPGRSANVLNEEFGRGLAEALAHLQAETDLAGVILTSGKKNLSGGGGPGLSVRGRRPRRTVPQHPTA